MNHEIALKLKNAGFPIINDTEHENTWKVDGVRYDGYQPTLEELIEAVGDDFYSLQKKDKDKDTGWRCYAKASVILDSFEGSTPIEAVSNLWLALHGTETNRSKNH